MAYEIKIYGEIISTYAKENGGRGVSLSDLQAMLDKAEGQDIKVRFNSPGGDVQEGFAMYDELRRYAKENKAKIHTFAESVLASIATVPFLAGDTRTVSKSINPFVHNAWMMVEGDSSAMRKAHEDLEAANDKIARHYSDHTELTYKEARALMDGDTSLSAKDALAIRFATNIEKIMRPAALQRFTTNKPEIKMNNKKEKSLMAQIRDLVMGVPQAKKVMAADQKVVDFYELEEDEPIETGANATIDGAKAEGEVTMADGRIFIFENGVLIEIRDPEMAEEADDELAEALAQVAALTTERDDLKAKYEASVASNKELRGTLNKINALQSEFGNDEEDEPATPPQNNRKNKPTVKGSRAGSAVSGLLKNTKNN